jgi:hypothetical protein
MKWLKAFLRVGFWSIFHSMACEHLKIRIRKEMRKNESPFRVHFSQLSSLICGFGDPKSPWLLAFS